MADVIKLRKGLDINLKGKASMDVTLQVKQAEEYALVPDAFVGVTPKVVVKEGVHVNSGDALFALVVAAPVLGHAFSPMAKFRGGKAIAALFGVCIALLPVI